MSKKKSVGGIVYSTDPDFKIDEEQAEEQSSIAASEQKLRVKLDMKNRGGKAVTLVENYLGSQSEKDELGKKLKSFCGTGGAVKGDEILVQGDNREKVFQWLLKNGFKQTKKL